MGNDGYSTNIFLSCMAVINYDTVELLPSHTALTTIYNDL
jgi:hypothetical protein